MLNDIRVVATFLVLMFVISGANKVLSGGASESDRLATKTGIEARLCTLIVFCAGLWELLGAGLVLYGVWSKNSHSNTSLVQLGVTSLSLFTIIATVIFYMKPFKYNPVLANMTALAGLMLLPKVCELRHPM